MNSSSPSVRAAETVAPVWEVVEDYSPSRLRTMFWFVAIVLGFLQAWASRHSMGPDGISYLDMGDAIFRGDWNMAINAYWSPLYPFVLGLAAFLFKPSPYWEFTMVHLVNFAIYVFALGCFEFFLRGLIAYHRTQQDLSDPEATLPEWAWQALGYSLFVWMSLHLISLQGVSPDMCGAAFLYLAAGFLVRIRGGQRSWPAFAFLGATLGMGYLARAAMFPLAFVFLATSFFAAGGSRRTLPRVTLALVVFLLVAGPWVLELSRAKGRPTFGDSGRLAYAEFVSGVKQGVHWQGEGAGVGTPIHPTRKISEVLPIYEFAGPIGGTYPPWYDQSYWYEGVVARFNLRGQLLALSMNAHTYLTIIVEQGTLIVGFLTLFIYAQRGRFLLGRMANQWHLIIPALTALCMYALVYVTPRYVGSYLLLLWIGVFSGISLTNTEVSRRLMRCVTIAMAVALVAFSTMTVAKDLAASVLLHRTPVQWKIAEDLYRLGVQPGDRVAVIGDGFECYWARLGRFKIAAETPRENANSFWGGSREVRSRAIQRFAATGAKVIVAERVPPFVSTDVWIQIGPSGYYAYVLPKRDTP
jgi:hypothetical protein